MPAGDARKKIEKFKPLILVEVHTAANKCCLFVPRREESAAVQCTEPELR